jgi:hypothetical protein
MKLNRPEMYGTYTVCFNENIVFLGITYQWDHF